VFLCVLTRNIDHAVLPAFAPPQGASGTADHFDPVDVLQQIILHVPKKRRKKSGVYRVLFRPPKPKSLFAKRRVESASADGPVVGVLLCHL